jgi:hypothetical protein
LRDDPASDEGLQGTGVYPRTQIPVLPGICFTTVEIATVTAQEPLWRCERLSITSFDAEIF